MSAVRVDILCECEACYKRFGVEIDIAEDWKGGYYADADEAAREYIRGGNAAYYTWAVRGKQTVDRISLSGSPTIQADLMLCDVCTKKCDDLEGIPEDRNLTRAEVNKALGLHEETT